MRFSNHTRVRKLYITNEFTTMLNLILAIGQCFQVVLRRTAKQLTRAQFLKKCKLESIRKKKRLEIDQKFSKLVYIPKVP